MSKKALIVGNCNYDGPKIVSMIQDNVEDSEAIESKTINEAIKMLKDEHFDLIAVNRVGDKDKKNALELIDWVQKNDKDTPIMIITNFEDKMHESIKHGAVPGFGKKQLESEDTIKLLKKYLK